MKTSFLALAYLLLLPLGLGAQTRSLFIEDLTWTEIRDAIAAGKTTAIYYTGGSEQNGPHMVTGKHNFVARHVARRIAEQLGNALVYPVMPFAPTGDPVARTGQMRYAGSINISDELFGRVAADVAASAISAGFKTVLIMGDHGGGQPALEQTAVALDATWKPKGVRVYYIADVYKKAGDQARQYLDSHGIKSGGHADADDTSQIMAIDSTHTWIRADKLAPGTPESGVTGDPRSASAELGRRFLDFKVAAAVAQIRTLTASTR